MYYDALQQQLRMGTSKKSTVKNRYVSSNPVVTYLYYHRASRQYIAGTYICNSVTIRSRQYSMYVLLLCNWKYMVHTNQLGTPSTYFVPKYQIDTT